jgi:hypothetical protein
VSDIGFGCDQGMVWSGKKLHLSGRGGKLLLSDYHCPIITSWAWTLLSCKQAQPGSRTENYFIQSGTPLLLNGAQCII